MKFYECYMSLDMDHADIKEIDNVPDEIIKCLSAQGRNFDDNIEGVNHFAAPSIQYAKIYVKRQIDYYGFVEWDDMPGGTYRLTLNGVALTMLESSFNDLYDHDGLVNQYRDMLKHHTPVADDQPITPHTVIDYIMRVPNFYEEEGE